MKGSIEGVSRDWVRVKTPVWSMGYIVGLDMHEPLLFDDLSNWALNHHLKTMNDL
jgi:hypothetical protein